MRRALTALLLLLVACGPDTPLTTTGEESTPMDAKAVTAQARDRVEQVLDATVPGRERTPRQGSGELGPPCTPDGPVTRSMFIGMTSPLEDGDDPAGLVRDAADWFDEHGLDVSSVRLDPPQQGVHASDAAGGTYSFRILGDGEHVAASANTPCLPDDADERARTHGERADEDEMAEFLLATAEAVAPGAPVGTVPVSCEGGIVVQRTVDLPAGQGAAALDRVVERWGQVGNPAVQTSPDGTSTVEVADGETTYQAVVVADVARLILAAERGCEEG